MVIFTSDNGPWLPFGKNAGIAGPLRGGKFSCWEGGMREPTIAWWPGRIPAGSTCDAMASNIDMLPTLVALAGGVVPSDRIIDGRDIWPLLSGKSTESPHDALYYWSGLTLAAVRSGEWKLMVAEQKEGKAKEEADASTDKQPFAPQLYNLNNDIGETQDVAAQHPEEVKRLIALIERMDKDLGARGSKALGIRPVGKVDKPQPLLK